MSTDRRTSAEPTPGGSGAPLTEVPVVDLMAEEATVAGLVADAARALADEPTLQQTLDRVVELAVAMVDGCDEAGISLVTRRRIESAAVSDPVVARGDALQYEFDEGPCLDAIREHALVESGDVAADPRWPRWAPRVSGELGVRSMLCVQLYVGERARRAQHVLGVAGRVRSGLPPPRVDVRRRRSRGDLGRADRGAAPVRRPDPHAHRAGPGHHHGAVLLTPAARSP